MALTFLKSVDYGASPAGKSAASIAPRSITPRAAAGKIPEIKTTVTTDFVIPAVGATDDIQVANSSIFWIGQRIFLADRGAPHAMPEGVGTWCEITAGSPPPKS